MNVVRTIVMFICRRIVESGVERSRHHCAPCLLAIFLFVLVGGLVKLIPFFPKKTGVAKGVTIAVMLTLYAFVVVGLCNAGRC